jgi:hypothetical protein
MRLPRLFSVGEAQQPSLAHPTFLQLLFEHHDLDFNERLRVYIQKWEIAARNLQDPERLQ